MLSVFSEKYLWSLDFNENITSYPVISTGRVWGFVFFQKLNTVVVVKGVTVIVFVDSSSTEILSYRKRVFKRMSNCLPSM